MNPDTRKKLLDELFAEREALEKRIARLESTQPEDARQELRELRVRADEIGRRWSELQDEDIHDDDRGGIER
jgi:hypothetical protein